MEPYTPQGLPLSTIDYGRLIGLVGKANAELARYDGLLQGIVNPNVLLSPLTTQEAVLSSKIEGTQATLDEVLEHEAGQTFTGEKNQDIKESGLTTAPSTRQPLFRQARCNCLTILKTGSAILAAMMPMC